LLKRKHLPLQHARNCESSASFSEAKTVAVKRELCPLCDQDADSTWSDPVHSVLQVECKRCGCFAIALEASPVLVTIQDQRHLLSAYCRRFPRISSPPLLTPESVARIIRDLSHYTPPEKLDTLLECIARKSPGHGDSSAFDANLDYPLLFARHPAEASYFLTELGKREYVEETTEGPLLTLKGWERIEEIRRSGHSSNRAFVAMWFDKKMDDLYAKAIDPAIRKAKYLPLRIDRHEHVNRIDDEIIGQIKRSRFMVADFTGQRHGVYFEAGLMMGLGRTVIWMCNKNELDKIHFDVIDYESLEDANTRLHHRILAIEGEGPGELE
jgi:hypothetical protein